MSAKSAASSHSSSLRAQALIQRGHFFEARVFFKRVGAQLRFGLRVYFDGEGHGVLRHKEVESVKLPAMKRPLKAREVAFVLLPALALGGFGWYQWRVEQVSDGRAMFVSSVQLLPETRGSYQATGTTHRLVGTVDHPWPRPRWWGKPYSMSAITDGLASNDDLRHVCVGVRPEECLSFGHSLTTTASGRKEYKVQGTTNWAPSNTFEDGHYIFTHELAVANAPTNQGAITFHGLYRIAGQKPIRVTRTVRKAGEVIPFKPNNKPDGRVLSILAMPFPKRMGEPTGEQWADVIFSITSTPAGHRVSSSIGHLQLRDAAGKVFNSYDTPGFSNAWGDATNRKVNDGISKPLVALRLSNSLKTTNPLTLSGTVSIDDGWPIPFSVRLPPR